jgi:hypothetical protein
MLLTWVVGGLGVTVRAADVGAAAVDEPQYLLTALSLAEDRDLDISDERAHVRYLPFHDPPLPVQTSVLEDGRRVSPHDPLLPALLAPAMALGGWVAAKAVLVALGGLVAGGIVLVSVTRFGVSVPVATVAGAVTGASTPLAVYAHQVYPEVPAALAVLAAVAALVPRRGAPQRWTTGRAVLLVLAVSALPWLSVKYVPVAAGLALLALVGLARDSRRRLLGVASALAVSGVLWVLAHRAWYGGWTAYATGDTFEESGEFGVVGFSPDLGGRSVRLVGLLVDRDYGLAAWQPVWLLLPLAVGVVLALRVPHRGALLLPAVLGWLSATFVALTMHGYWWPGRQLVVVVPVLAILVALGVDRLTGPAGRTVRVVAAVAASVGLAVHAWVLVAGHRGRLTWVLDPAFEPPAPLAWGRLLLPDYRRDATTDWALHAVWVALALGLGALGWWLARRAGPEAPPAPDRPTTTSPRIAPCTETRTARTVG